MSTTPEDLPTVNQVRTLIADTDPVNRLFTDGQLAVYVDLNGGNARLAAADALEAIAVSEVLVSKKIRTQDLTTDGPAVSAELRALAKQLRAQAEHAEAAADLWDGFDVAYPGRGGRRPEHTNYPVEVWGL